MNKRRKVLLIGLDGATLDLIRPMVREGRLPTIARFLEEGVHGELISTVPYVSTVAWASLVTGTNPGKHGIFGLRALRRGDYDTGVVSLRSCKAKPIWTTLSERGLRVGVINVPFTFPPENVNGFFIAGAGSPGGLADITYPAQLYDEIQKDIGGYEIEPSFWGKTNYEEADKILRAMERTVEKRAEVTKYLMDKYPWDFLNVVFVASDRIPHIFWHCMDKDHIRFGEKGSQRYRNAIMRTYEKLDKAIETILTGLDRETTAIIVSDHGMGPFHRTCPYLDLNLWLNQEGYLRLSEETLKDKAWRFLLKSYFNLKPAIDKAKKLKLYKLIYKAKKDAKSRYLLSCVDWRHTKAYSPFGEKISTHIVINQKGRQPKGIVEPGVEYETLREEIIGRLEEIKLPGTCDGLIKKAYKREELYRGKYLESAPDIIIEWQERFLGDMTTKWPDRVNAAYPFSHRHRYMQLSGQHRRAGIFFARGPHIKKTGNFDKAQITDVAPTILYSLGLPVSRDMDGKVLDHIFNESFLKANPIRHSQVEEPFVNTGSELYSQEEKDAIENKLKSIGYI